LHQRPIIINLYVRIFPQLILQLMADWLRIAAEIAMERRHAGGLFVNNVAGVGLILIGGDRKQTDQESEINSNR
jgi:hypothetical protein